VRAGRWARFNAVAFAGFSVQTATVWVLVEHLGMHYLAAVAVALEAAILHNYAWHARWTWRDRPPADGGVRRLLQYNVVASATAAANLACVAALVEAWRVPYLLASVLGVGLCAVINFVVADTVVFRAGAGAHRGGVSERLETSGHAGWGWTRVVAECLRGGSGNRRSGRSRTSRLLSTRGRTPS
jgi:putative flippase GtrA